MKHTLRLMTGKTLKLAGFTEAVRKLYFSRGKSYLNGLGKIQGAWFRRSLVTQDFVPVISDIDLTLLLNSSQIQHLYKTRQLKRRPPLLQDIQVVYEPFIDRWLRTGGIRNRQIQSWINIAGDIKLSAPSEHTREILAFEISHELYLLYKQLVPKLSSSHRDETAAKLFYEMNRLIQFWSTGNENLLREPRSNFSFNLKDSETSFFRDLNALCTDLLRNVNHQLSTVQPEKIMLETGKDWIRLNHKMENRFVNLVSPENVARLAIEFPDDFVATKEFVALSLGVGIQDQPHLNQLAWKKSGYYRDFCTQRLAHDLIGSILLHPENNRQLYFCFKNIDEFLKGFEGLRSEGWQEVSIWNGSEPFPLGNEDVLLKTLRNLELLAVVR